MFRGRDKPPIREVWEAYQYGKQTYAQLSVRYGCSVRTIQRWLDKLEARASARTSSLVKVGNEEVCVGLGMVALRSIRRLLGRRETPCAPIVST